MLLQEEKLAGASLLVLANKQDLPGALPLADIERVSSKFCYLLAACATSIPGCNLPRLLRSYGLQWMPVQLKV